VVDGQGLTILDLAMERKMRACLGAEFRLRANIRQLGIPVSVERLTLLGGGQAYG
jgi:hypothetical protein